MNASKTTTPTISATAKIGCPIASFVVAEATAAIRQIAERVMGVSSEDAAPLGGEKKSLLGGFDFKSMLAKKPKVDLTKAD